MKKILFLSAALHLSGYLHAVDLEKPARLQQVTREEKEQAEKLAYDYWLQNVGLLAEERIIAEGKLKLGRDYEGFAERGTTVWELRVIHIDGATNGIIWINTETKFIHSMGGKITTEN